MGSLIPSSISRSRASSPITISLFIVTYYFFGEDKTLLFSSESLEVEVGSNPTISNVGSRDFVFICLGVVTLFFIPLTLEDTDYFGLAGSRCPALEIILFAFFHVFLYLTGLSLRDFLDSSLLMRSLLLISCRLEKVLFSCRSHPIILGFPSPHARF